MNEDYPAFQKWYRILDWILNTCEKYPKSVRFTFSNRIINYSMDILEKLITAIYQKNKKPILNQINLIIEMLRVFFRLSFERRYISNKQYLYIATEINEFGQMIGGWVKSCKE